MTEFIKAVQTLPQALVMIVLIIAIAYVVGCIVKGFFS